MAKKTATTTSDFNAQIVAFRTDLREFKGKNFLELVCDYKDLTTGKTFTAKAKQYPVFDDKGLEMLTAISQRAFSQASADKKSFELRGEKGLVKTAQANGNIGMAI